MIHGKEQTRMRQSRTTQPPGAALSHGMAMARPWPGRSPRS